MDQNFQTSFIPKRPVTEDRPVRSSSVSVFLFIAVVFLIASIGSAAFVYIYKTSLTRQVAQMKDDLDKAKGAFEDDFIKDLQTIDRRINTANQVLAGHIAVSPIFQALQQSTLKSIQFTKFTYKITGSGQSSQIDVDMSGKAQSYTSIALESDQLTKNKYIRDPIFSNLTLDDKGNVLFDLVFSVDPKLVMFSEVVAKTPINTTQTSTTNTLNDTLPVVGGQQ